MASFSKFVRPEIPRRCIISERDLDILDAVLRYRFCSAAQIVRLVGGNEDVTHRRLRGLWECGLVNRWAFPGVRTHSEFYYYLDNREPLDLLAERRRFEIHPQMLDEIRSHREKDYAGAAVRGQHMQLGFLNHGLMVSRMHFMVEMACKKSGGVVALEAWRQGGQVAGHKVDVQKVKVSRQGGEFFWQEVHETERLPVEPDALFTLRFADRAEGHHLTHYCYEADRGSMVMTDMLKKFRGYYQFIKKQQKHREAFGVHPIRAVLVETTDEARGKKLMELVGHPLVAGPGKRAGLFWFSISPLFTDPAADSPIPSYLDRPQSIFEPIWALPDHSLHALNDAENTSPALFLRHHQGDGFRCHGSQGQLVDNALNPATLTVSANSIASSLSVFDSRVNSDGGSQKGSHFGIGVVPPPTARSPESLSLLSGRSCRTARSCQGRAVVGRGEANP